MYQITSQSAKTLIDGGNIRLPRFQRKQTWNNKKNFMLCISIFNDYPIGMFVLNKEKVRTRNGIIDTLWLLDGRQRRNAINQMYANPENIYIWAKAFIKFKTNAPETDIEESFWKAVEVHLETDEDEDTSNVTSANSENYEQTDDEDNEIYEDDELFEDNELEETVDEENNNAIDQIAATTEPSDDLKSHQGLKLLLQIILMCHKVNKRYSGYSRPFDFSKYFIHIDYAKIDPDGGSYLDGQILTDFIISFNSHCDRLGTDDFSESDFIDFLCTRYTLQQDNRARTGLERKVNYSWEKIKKIIIYVKQISLRLHNTKIGVIELSNVKSSDAQNIFKLINSSGTSLAAVEILSAKPSWNRPLTPVTNELELAVDNLYKTLKVKRDGVVRWDFPATIIDRLNNLDFIFKDYNYSVDSEFKTKVTLGFKLLAAIFENGVTKEKISSMSRSSNIIWEEIESIVNDLEVMGRLLKNEAFFQYLKSWNTTLIELTSEAIAINFVTLLYKNWTSKNKPMGNGTLYESFKKDTFSLFDRMIYEYTLKQWRGSSDSKIADNISNFNPNTTFRSIPVERWKDLLEELIEHETIQDQKVGQKEIKPILYYYYVLSNKLAPEDTDKTYEMDHIISKSTFTSSTLGNDHHVDNICNFCLLRKHDNIIKKAKSLHTINQLASTDQNYRLIQQRISNSADIAEDDFGKFSTAANFEELVNLRKALLLEAFDTKRTQIIG